MFYVSHDESPRKCCRDLVIILFLSNGAKRMLFNVTNITCAG